MSETTWCKSCADAKPKIKVACRSCAIETNHEVLCQTGEDTDNEFSDYTTSTRYQIVRCCGCETTSFRHTCFDSMWDREPFVEIFPEPRGDHPLRSADFRQEAVYQTLSGNIKGIYSEMREAFNNRMFILCSIGLRGVVEAICADRNIINGPKELSDPSSPTVNNLQGKINGLAKRSILTPAHADFLHQHRFMGNDSVHELVCPEEKDLVAAIDIINHTLDGLYRISRVGEDLKARRAPQVAAAPSPPSP